MFERLLQALNRVPVPQPALPVEGELLALLEQTAADEHKTLSEVIHDLLWQALADRHAAVENFQPWEELTPREKQAAALACLGYTNYEIAELMVISSNTVKTHLRHVLRKFNVRSKAELRDVLAGWDFAHWLEEQTLWPQDAPSLAGAPGLPGAPGSNGSQGPAGSSGGVTP